MTTQQSHDIEPGQSWEVDRFRPEDAEGVVRLFHSVYGDGYPVRTYLEPELLIRENRAERVISSVARTPTGDIVGHAAIFNSAPNPRIYESGAGLVQAAYRGGKGLGAKLVAHGLTLAETLPGVDVVFGEPVCNHIYMQQLTVKLGFVFTAMEADLMPAGAYEAEGSATGRVAAFLCFRIFRKEPGPVYFPRAYASVLPFFYEGVERDCVFAVSESLPSTETVSDITHEVFDFANVARISVRKVGFDFSGKVRALEKVLEAKGVLVFQVWLNLADPANGEGVELLKDAGYFIGGVLPCWFGTDGLLMQKMKKRPDWEEIHVGSDRSGQILLKIRSDWERSCKEELHGD